MLSRSGAIRPHSKRKNGDDAARGGADAAEEREIAMSNKELEQHIASLGSSLQNLAATVTDQGHTLNTLHAENQRLNRRVTDLEDRMGADSMKVGSDSPAEPDSP